LLATLVFSLFAACLYRAVALTERGQGNAAIGYILVGVPGVFASVILGLMFVLGLP
jgi:hypothetical protein